MEEFHYLSYHIILLKTVNSLKKKMLLTITSTSCDTQSKYHSSHVWYTCMIHKLSRKYLFNMCKVALVTAVWRNHRFFSPVAAARFRRACATAVTAWEMQRPIPWLAAWLCGRPQLSDPTQASRTPQPPSWRDFFPLTFHLHSHSHYY